MADDVASARWINWLQYCVVAALIAFFQLLPINISPGKFPGPDTLFAVTLCWALRRPDLLPTPLIAIVFLLADILFMRPLGLWAGVVVLSVEFLRTRSAAWRDLNFILEWLMVSGVVVGAMLANVVILAIFVIEQPSFGLTLIRLLATIAIYPVVTVVLKRFFGLKKLAPGAVDRLGHRH